MLITKENPAGLDAAVHDFQNYMHDKLLTAWGISSGSYKCYPRAYRNRKPTGYIAEIYEGNGNYRDAYWDDTLAAVSFFGTSGEITGTSTERTQVHLVFFVDLNKVKAGIAHRADEEARRDVIKLVQSPSYGFEYTGTEIWVENVLKEYPGLRRDEKLSVQLDTGPVHCFRLNFDVSYNPNRTCTPLKSF